MTKKNNKKNKQRAPRGVIFTKDPDQNTEAWFDMLEKCETNEDKYDETEAKSENLTSDPEIVDKIAEVMSALTGLKKEELLAAAEADKNKQKRSN